MKNQYNIYTRREKFYNLRIEKVIEYIREIIVISYQEIFEIWYNFLVKI